MRKVEYRIQGPYTNDRGANVYMIARRKQRKRGIFFWRERGWSHWHGVSWEPTFADAERNILERQNGSN